MKNNEYWAKRFKALEERSNAEAQKCAAESMKLLEDAVIQIDKDITYWLKRFADNNNMTLAKAKKAITSKELKELGWDVEEYVRKGYANTYLGDWSTELENASARYHLTRLDAIKLQIQKCCDIAFTSIVDSMTGSLSNVYKDVYYRVAYEVQKGTGIGFSFAQVDENKLKMILERPWAVDGDNFSQRVWGNYRPKLTNKIQQSLTDWCVRGTDPKKLARKLSYESGVTQSACNTLIRTETAQICTRAEMDCYDELGVEKYRILETLDGKTCKVCADMDSKVFNRDEFEVGITAPPFHPRCRGTTVPEVDDELLKKGRKRAARDPETGKTVYIEDMTYKEWKEKFVTEKGQEAWNFYEKGTKNRTSDAKQFEKYKSVLGKNAPKNLEEFQKLKYIDYESYRFVKLDYMRQNTLLENPELKLPKVNEVIIDDRKFTGYLFNPANTKGFAKGKAFTSRLGYDIINYKDLQKEILYSSSRYPAIFKDNNGYGNIYEQKIILYGNKGKPANVVVGWLCNDSGTKMTSVYIKEV